MTESLKQHINNFCKAKVELMKTQQAVRFAHTKLLHTCIETGNIEFLKLDEEAVKRYVGIRDWQLFPDS